ncbi:hypothetical protein JCM19992_34130 [Thermostilla marina]
MDGREYTGRFNRLVAIAATLGVCATTLVGCLGYRIDPTGERLFIPANTPVEPGSPANAVIDPGPYRAVPSRGSLCSDLVVTPAETAMPVGSEVVLIASVVGKDDYMVTNQRVEWTIPPESVGEFVDFAKAGLTDYLVGDFTRPRKITDRFVVTSSVRKYLQLTRGTVSPDDDVYIRPGQAWVTVTSHVEGTSVVSAYAPCVQDWQRRVQTAVIHWVDAEWMFPSPVILPAGGRGTLTTKVTHRSDGSPCSGWKVRYEITGGAAAAFGPSGGQVAEVPVDSMGQATVDVYQTQALGGTTQVRIQIIRPGDAPGAGGKQLNIGCGSTMVTWSAPQLSVRVTGPGVVGRGGSGTYTIEVSNPGDLPAQNVVLTHPVMQGAMFQASSPPAVNSGTQLQWQVGTLSAHETRNFQVTYSFPNTGALSCCAQATADGGLSAQNCTNTTVGTSQLELVVRGPDQATVGQEVTYIVELINRGQVAAPNIVVRDTFDRGLQHPAAVGGIERALPGGVNPGETKRISITFRVVEAGSWCHTVTIFSDGQAAASRQMCLTASAAPQPAQPTPSATGAAPPTPQPGATSNPGTSPLEGGIGISPGTSPPPGSSTPSVPTTPPLGGSGTGAVGEGGPSTPGETSTGASAGTLPPLPGTNAGAMPPETGSGTSAVQPPGPAPVDVTFTGSPNVRLGESARYQVEIINRGTTSLEGVRVLIDYDETLEPTHGSSGYTFVGNALQWVVDLEPNKGVRLTLNCKATQVKEQACVNVKISIPDGRELERTACTRVEPIGFPGTLPPGTETPLPEGNTGVPASPTGASDSPTMPPAAPGGSADPLLLSVVDRYNPIAVGRTKQVVFKVINQGSTAANDVVLKVESSPSLRLDRVQSRGPTALDGRSSAQSIIFQPMSTLGPGEQVEYNVVMSAESPGEAVVSAEVQAAGLSPVVRQVTTTVVGAP